MSRNNVPGSVPPCSDQAGDHRTLSLKNVRADRSATSALVCYERQSDFHFPDCNKPPTQSTVFCMRVRDDGGKLTPGEHDRSLLVTTSVAGCALTPMALCRRGHATAPSSSARAGPSTNTTAGAAARPAGTAQAACTPTSGAAGSGARARSDAAGRVERAGEVSRTIG